MNISSVPSMGILRVVQMDAEDVYESSKLNSYKSLHFSSAESLKAGENTLALTAFGGSGEEGSGSAAGFFRKQYRGCCV